MGKNKKTKQSIESIKRRIEDHFEKLEKEIEADDEILARYYIKEIDRSSLDVLERKMKFLEEVNEELIERYRKKLRKIEEKLSNSGWISLSLLKFWVSF